MFFAKAVYFSMENAARYDHLDVIRFFITNDTTKHFINAYKHMCHIFYRALNDGSNNIVKYLLKDNAVQKFNIIETLLKAYGDINFVLADAARSNNLDIITFIIEENVKEFITTQSINEALAQAAERGHIQIVTYLITNQTTQQLIDSGSFKSKSIDSYGINGAIGLAAKEGYLNIIKFLITHEATQALLTREGVNDALSLAAKGGHFDIVILLTTHPITKHNITQGDLNKGVCAAIKNAAFYKHITILKYLVNNTNTQNKITTQGVNKALAYAAINNDLETFEFLLINKITQTKITAGNSCSGIIGALRYAAEKSYTEIISHLIDNQTKEIIEGLLAKNNDNKTSIQNIVAETVIQLNSLNVFKMFFIKNLISSDKEINWAFRFAAEQGRNDIIELLINNENVRNKITTDSIDQALKNAALNEYENIIDSLLTNQNFKDKISRDGIKKALVWAQRNNLKDSVELLEAFKKENFTR